MTVWRRDIIGKVFDPLGLTNSESSIGNNSNRLNPDNDRRIKFLMYSSKILREQGIGNVLCMRDQFLNNKGQFPNPGSKDGVEKIMKRKSPSLPSVSIFLRTKGQTVHLLISFILYL